MCNMRWVYFMIRKGDLGSVRIMIASRGTLHMYVASRLANRTPSTADAAVNSDPSDWSS